MRRTGSHPGPLLLTVFACFVVAGAILRAHDPGLSTLDVTAAGARVSATLSLSAPDAQLAAPGADALRAATIATLATRAIEVRADDRWLEPVVERAWMQEGAAHVALSFTATGPVTRLSVRSAIPATLARGHRQLLTVRSASQVLTERLLDASSAAVPVALDEVSPSGSAMSLFGLGVGHILAGFDHLVFLAGLLLAARSVRELVTALTAFTVAHSITLAAAASGLVHAPPSIVEPLIAASIAWVGIENLLNGASAQTGRAGRRWLVVFGFGLVHGFGFAEALLDLGRWSSASDVAVTLLSFNAGVEAAQLAVAAALLPFVWLVRARPAWNARLVPVFSLTIVAAGCYWLIERLA